MQSESVVKQIITWAGLFKAKFVWPRVSVESDFRFDSFKRKFSQIIFVHNMILWCSKNDTGHYPKRPLNKGIKKPKLKFNLGLVLMGLQTTGSWSCKWKPANNNLVLMNKRAGLIHIIPKSITRNYCNGISNGKTVDCHVSGGTLDNLHVFPSCN